MLRKGLLAGLWVLAMACTAPAWAVDLSQSDRDFDMDFEADDVLALNLTNKGRAAARQLGFRVRDSEPLRNLNLLITRLRPPPGVNARRSIDRLKALDPGGTYSANERYGLASAKPVSCDPARCFGPPMVGMADTCGVVARIGMVDSAVNEDLANFAHRKLTTKRFSSAGVDSKELAHGSAIAALLIGGPDDQPLGMLPKAELFAADVFSMTKEGKLSTDAARLASGLDWLSGKKPAAINLSLQGPDNPVLAVVTRRLLEQGVTLVAAAGNDGPMAPPLYPAAYPGVIAVTAVDRYGGIYPLANSGSYIALAAPGVNIWTVDGDGAAVLRDGTSFAAPFVTAAAVRFLNTQLGAKPADVADWLKGHAKDLGAKGPDRTFGAGLLVAPGC